jgi:hypothetical protein
VTRFGNFSHIGELFSLCTFLENYRSSLNVWVLLFYGNSYLCIDFDKKWAWATFWAIFFTNSSGHPGSAPVLRDALHWR